MPPAPREVTPEWFDLLKSLATRDARTIKPTPFHGVGKIYLSMLFMGTIFSAFVEGVTGGKSVGLLKTFLAINVPLLFSTMLMVVSSAKETVKDRVAHYLRWPKDGHRTRTFVEGEVTLCPVVEWTVLEPDGVHTGGYRGFGKLAFSVPDETGTQEFQTVQVAVDFGEACRARGVVPVLMRPGAVDAIIVMEPWTSSRLREPSCEGAAGQGEETHTVALAVDDLADVVDEAKPFTRPRLGKSRRAICFGGGRAATQLKASLRGHDFATLVQ